MPGPVVGAAFVRRYPALIWDFDGVIKESVEVKTEAFTSLFAPFGAETVERVRAHHRSNGGVSRFEKIPLYLQWAGLAASPQAVRQYCAAFSDTVRAAVIDADWVPGAREYLEANRARQHLGLVTATPQEEIEEIAGALGIAACFRGIYGAPLTKLDAVRVLLERWHCARADVLMIGDSDSDHAAAQRAGVGFLLRRTPLNRALQQSYDGPQCENFLHE
jgi:phosphoglycolate phosphatase-like HAD superfamily hydrolase